MNPEHHGSWLLLYYNLDIIYLDCHGSWLSICHGPWLSWIFLNMDWCCHGSCLSWILVATDLVVMDSWCHGSWLSWTWLPWILVVIKLGCHGSWLPRILFVTDFVLANPGWWNQTFMKCLDYKISDVDPLFFIAIILSRRGCQMTVFIDVETIWIGRNNHISMSSEAGNFYQTHHCSATPKHTSLWSDDNCWRHCQGQK